MKTATGRRRAPAAPEALAPLSLCEAEASERLWHSLLCPPGRLLVPHGEFQVRIFKCSSSADTGLVGDTRARGLTDAPATGTG